MTHMLCLLLGTLSAVDDNKEAEHLIAEARELFGKRDVQKAIAALDQAARKDPKNVEVYLLRGQMRGAIDQHRESLADFSRAIELDPKNPEGYDLRGSAHFMAGKIDESVADFDRYLKLKPAAANGHWRRGISLYYAGNFDEGRRQFEGYEKVDTNDVENAVWHFLCVARKDGVEKARASVLKIGRDRRVPMMTVYELFKGTASPQDVLKAVEEGKPPPEQRKFRLFYAHLYLGLYHEVTGDAKKALAHLKEAVKQPRVHPYMWDVARVHRDLLAAKK